MNKLYFLLIFPCIVYSELKIYDCFTFFNEIELLKIRFEELYNVVDKFVLVEATQTFTGEPKELFFLKNKNLFSKYEDKIIHVVVDDLEKIKGKTSQSAWQREYYQRNQVLKGLTGGLSDDIIILSDVDEIPKSIVVKDLKKSINEIVNLDMTYFRYQLNRLDSRILTNETHGPRVTSLKIIRKISPQGVRSYNCIHRIPDAAWHFSSMGGAESVLYKHRSFSHFYEISESFFVGNQNKLSLDMLNRYPAIPVDNFFPTYVIHNREYFQKIGFLAEVEETWKDDVEKAKRDLVWARGNKEYPYEWE